MVQNCLVTVFQYFPFNSRQVAYATSGKYTSCTEFMQCSRYTYIYSSCF